jgi:hypothetical protein
LSFLNGSWEHPPPSGEYQLAPSAHEPGVQAPSYQIFICRSRARPQTTYPVPGAALIAGAGFASGSLAYIPLAIPRFQMK